MKSAADEDSFEKGIFDCPHYTRPEVFEGHAVPEVLLSGNHQEDCGMAREQALEKTQRSAARPIKLMKNKIKF